MIKVNMLRGSILLRKLTKILIQVLYIPISSSIKELLTSLVVRSLEFEKYFCRKKMLF